MSDLDEQQNPSDGAGGQNDAAMQGDGSGNPGSDREFLQDLPPAEDKRTDDAEVGSAEPTDDAPIAEG